MSNGITASRAGRRTPFRVVETWDGWAAYSVSHTRMLATQFHPHHVRLIHGKTFERTTDAILGRTPFEALYRLKRFLEAKWP